MKSNIKLIYTAWCASLLLFMFWLLLLDLHENVGVVKIIAMSLPFFSISNYSLIRIVIYAVKRFKKTAAD